MSAYRARIDHVSKLLTIATCCPLGVPQPLPTLPHVSSFTAAAAAPPVLQGSDSTGVPLVVVVVVVAAAG